MIDPHQTLNLHATGIVLGNWGLLLRGPSGAGKSRLALALLDRAEGRGEVALLVSDDRIDVVQRGGALQMEAPGRLDGLIELRGRGLVRRPHQAQSPVHLLVDLVADLPRLPEPEAFQGELLGIALPRVPVLGGPGADLAHQVLLVAEALRMLAPPADP